MKLYTQHNHDPDALMTEQFAAKFLGFTARTLQAWRLHGRGPKFVSISSRAIRYRRRDLIEWTNVHLRASTSDVSHYKSEVISE